MELAAILIGGGVCLACSLQFAEKCGQRERDLYVPHRWFIWSRLFLVLGAFLIFAAGRASAAEPWPICPQKKGVAGFQTCVVDGDTIRMDDVTMRIAGIDAPERREDGFYQSRAALAAILGLAPVSVERVGEGGFGRPLVRLFVDGMDVADAMIAGGYAEEWQ
ncbi:MAG: hypothetical protein AAF619_13705 [Pseudomonadota bacterium]